MDIVTTVCPLCIAPMEKLYSNGGEWFKCTRRACGHIPSRDQMSKKREAMQKVSDYLAKKAREKKVEEKAIQNPSKAAKFSRKKPRKNGAHRSNSLSPITTPGHDTQEHLDRINIQPLKEGELPWEI